MPHLSFPNIKTVDKIQVHLYPTRPGASLTLPPTYPPPTPVYFLPGQVCGLTPSSLSLLHNPSPPTIALAQFFLSWHSLLLSFPLLLPPPPFITTYPPPPQRNQYLFHLRSPNKWTFVGTLLRYFRFGT